jgi:hypothetical protein
MKNRKRTGSEDPVFNPKRKLREWDGNADDMSYGKRLASKVNYTGNPAHKRDPGDFHLTPPSAARQNATLCDDAGVLERKKAKALLRDGARRGLIDARSNGEYPVLIWAVQDDVAFEAQLENEAKGEYHGYPMPLSDPFRSVILKAARSR